jgi:hypothetical protein
MSNNNHQKSKQLHDLIDHLYRNSEYLGWRKYLSIRQCIEWFMPPVIVATAVFPLERAQSFLQAGISSRANMKFKITPYNILHFWIINNGTRILREYKYALKGSSVKNSMLTHREYFTENFENALDPCRNSRNSLFETTKEGFESADSLAFDKIKANFSSFKNTRLWNMAVTGLTSAALGSAEAFLTGPFANMRFYHSIGFNTKVPEWKNKWRLLFAGFPLRSVKNSATVLGCFTATSTLQQPLQKIMPAEKWGVLPAQITSSIISGTFVGLLSNGLDVISKRRLGQISYTQKPGDLGAIITLPKNIEMAKKLYNAHGAKVFMVGASYSVIISVTAYFTFNLANNYIAKTAKNSNLLPTYYFAKRGFFKRPIEPISAMAETKAEEKAQPVRCTII